MIRVALVEDDLEIRKLVASLLTFYPDIECVGVFENAEDFLKKLPFLTADAVLMDIGLPEKTGIECVRAAKNRPEGQKMQFVMFTSHADGREVFEALAAGATGYVVKGGPPDRLVESLREVVAGGSPMSRQIARMVAESFQKTEKAHPNLEKLTPQEREVLKFLDKGLAYKEIATARFVTEHTIRTQVRSIYQKLQVHSRTEALNIFHGR